MAESALPTEYLAIRESIQHSEHEFDAEQPQYILDAQQIAQHVAARGDAIENMAYYPYLKSCALGFLAVAGANKIINDLADGSYGMIPLVGSVGIGIAAGRTSFQYFSTRRKRAAELVESQSRLSKSCGENVEFFYRRKTGLQLRWYGANNKLIFDEPLEDRAARIAAIAEHTGASGVHVSAELGSLLGLDQQTQSEREWLTTLRDRVEAGSYGRKQSVMSVSTDEFIDTVADLVVERPFTVDTELLNDCLMFLKDKKPDAPYSKIYSSGLDLHDVSHVQALANSLAREVRARLDDFDVVRDEGGKRRLYLHGQLARETARTASNPTIQWFGEGKFRGSQQLLHFFGKTSEQLEEVMRNPKNPKAAYEAALILAYIEIQKTKHGLNLQPSIETVHEKQVQPVYQGNLAEIVRDSKNTTMPHKLTKHRLAMLGIKVLALFGVWSAAQYPLDQVKGSIANNEILSPVDQTMSQVPRWLFAHTPDWMKSQHVNRSKPYTSDEKISYSSQSTAQNVPLWYIDSYNGGNSSGYWLTGVERSLDLNQEWYGWIETRPNKQEPAKIIENPHVDDEAGVLNGEPGFRVERTVQAESLNSVGLYVPVKNHSQLVGWKITDAKTHIDYYPPMHQQSNGPLYLSFIPPNNSQTNDAKANYSVTYWLKDGGDQGVGRASGVLTVKRKTGEWQAVDETSVKKAWDDTLGPDHTAAQAEAFLQGKKYELFPLDHRDFGDETELLKELLMDDNGNCYTSATALVLNDPKELNVASGFYNSNNSSGTEVLSSHELHAFAVDAAGNIHDATPPIRDQNNDALHDYFKENFSVQKSPDRWSLDNPTKVIMSLTAATFLAEIGWFVSTRSFWRYNRKKYETLKATTAQAGLDVIDHALFAGLTQEKITWSKQAASKTDIQKTIGGYDISTRQLLRVLRKYRKRNKSVPKEAVRTAKLLARNR